MRQSTNRATVIRDYWSAIAIKEKRENLSGERIARVYTQDPGYYSPINEVTQLFLLPILHNTCISDGFAT